MASNYRATVPIGDGVSRTLEELRARDMAALEQLPPSLRRMLNELTIELSAYTVLLFYQDICSKASSDHEAEVYTLRKLVQIESDDLTRFAAIYNERHRTQLPHDAADVSVLRYDVARRQRNRIRSGI